MLTSSVLGFAMPEAFAEAMANPQLPGSTVECHSFCGNAILEWRNCGGDSSDATKECTCASDSKYTELIHPCLQCGAALWYAYSKFLEESLKLCNLPLEPTGTVTSTAAPSTSSAAASSSAAVVSSSTIVSSSDPVSSSSTAAASSSEPASSTVASSSVAASSNPSSVTSAPSSTITPPASLDHESCLNRCSKGAKAWQTCHLGANPNACACNTEYLNDLNECAPCLKQYGDIDNNYYYITGGANLCHGIITAGLYEGDAPLSEVTPLFACFLNSR